eukprot:TRINITY_DN11911_c0_g1_i2.p1 TRINITY_DN11911_c0_g1~~TRINITY_DN11911_c0_g1_i2.p1  ORF type:complete len:337 (-),score=24.63 TRINITY_DN11911_c0_g1_i2:141-1151(-)
MTERTSNHIASKDQAAGEPFTEGANISDIEAQEYKEPETHILNVPFHQRYLSRCFIRRDRLNPLELRHYYHERRQANIYFDPNNEDHTNKLRGLWLLLKAEPLGEEIKRDEWTKYGFQNHDPRTDFRGGGIMSLLHIIHFVETKKDIVEKMCDEKADFFFAISSINVTYYMKKYFHLLNHLVYELDKSELGSRRSLKNFCVMMKDDLDVLLKLHALFLQDFFAEWLLLKKRDPKATIMDVGKALDNAKNRFQRAINLQYFHSFAEFERVWAGDAGDDQCAALLYIDSVHPLSSFIQYLFYCCIPFYIILQRFKKYAKSSTMCCLSYRVDQSEIRMV